MNDAAFAAALNLFLLVVASRHPQGKAVGFEVNRTMVRVFAGWGNFRSVLYFVERETGLVRRADSWKKAGRYICDLSAPHHPFTFASPANLNAQETRP